jgi:polyhydroxyalkanoate synthase subunit PhaC
MDKTNSSSDQYNKNKQGIFSFYDIFFINMYNTFGNALLSSIQFNTELFNAFAQAYRTYLNTISGYNRSWKYFAELDKTLRSRFQKIFDEKFREERFVNSLSDTVASYSELAKITGLGKMYQRISNRMAEWNNDFVEPIRDTLYRTPSQKICELEKYSLFRYNKLNHSTNAEKASIPITHLLPTI